MANQMHSFAPAQRVQTATPFAASASSCFKPFTGRRPARAATLRVLAQQRFATQLIGGGSGANQVFVAGAEGQLGARIVQRLLQDGKKVTAAVSDEEKARAVVSFATAVELLRKPEAQRLSLAEVDLADEDSITDALSGRGARVVAVVGESASKGARVDARAATRLLLAAQSAGAGQFVLVTPSGAAGGGGLLGGFFGGSGAGGGSGSRPSKLEQDIASSGLDFAIIRTGRTDVQDADFEAGSNVAVGAQGSLPKQARLTKSQAAQVVQQVLRLADTDVLVEAWASADAPALDIEDAVLQALPDATIEQQELEEEDAEEETSSSAAAEEEPEPTKAPGGFFGSFGTQRIKAGSQPGPADAPAPKAVAGTARVKPGRRAGAQEPAPAQPKRQGVGFGRRRAPETADEKAEEDASYNPTGALRNLFRAGKKQIAEPGADPNKARRSAAKGIKAAGNGPTTRGKVGSSRPGADDPRPRKGFLASIGLGGETSFVDDED